MRFSQITHLKARLHLLKLARVETGERKAHLLLQAQRHEKLAEWAAKEAGLRISRQKTPKD